MMLESSVPFRKDDLSNLQPSAKRYYITDAKTRGLRLAVFPSGVKTYILFRKVNGVSQRIKIGRFEDLTIELARSEAKRLNSLITLGQDPHRDRVKQRKAITFRELYELYYQHHALKFTKRPLDNRKMMEFYVFPALGNDKANQITAEKIKNFHTHLGEKHKKTTAKKSKRKTYTGATANRLIALVSAVYNFGIRNQLIDCVNPCTGLRKYKTVSRDRFLSFEELDDFNTALELETEIFRDFFKILLYTGARKSNVLSMQWVEVNLDLKRWRIGETQTKNRDVNIVPLSESALEILQRRYQDNKNCESSSNYVFPGPGIDGHLNDPKRAFERIKKHMKVDDIRIHDLRRTLGSYMAIGGTSLPIIGKALNHKSQVSTAIYARLSNDPILEAVNLASQLMTKSRM